jgi:hypothetical protein
MIKHDYIPIQAMLILERKSLYDRFRLMDFRPIAQIAGWNTSQSPIPTGVL